MSTNKVRRCPYCKASQPDPLPEKNVNGNRLCPHCSGYYWVCGTCGKLNRRNNKCGGCGRAAPKPGSYMSTAATNQRAYDAAIASMRNEARRVYPPTWDEATIERYAHLRVDEHLTQDEAAERIVYGRDA